MLAIDANVSRYRFECAQLDPSRFQVVSFVGTEELSRPFQFDLELVSSDPEIVFADVVNEPAIFAIQRGGEQVPVCGFVLDLKQAGRSPDYFAYRAVLVPRLVRLKLTHQSRVFQHLSAAEIIAEVLQQNGFSAGDYRFEIDRSLDTREYCVQFNETDFDFVSRLLEHEGICYFFEHDGEKDVLVMTDDRNSHPRIEGDDLLRYEQDVSMVRDREAVYEAVYRERLVTEKVKLADFNDQSPDGPIQGESSPIEGQQGLRYEYGSHVAENGQASTFANIRKEEIDCARRTLDGRSDCGALRSGHTFALEGHYRSSLNQDYLVTRVEHRGSQSSSMGLMGIRDRRRLDTNGSDYENNFTAIPAGQQYRPPRKTPVPRVPGLLTGKLETGGGEYAYIDDQGRYRFRNIFDLGGAGASQASLPARKVQQNSGPGYGIHFPDHAENEVVLAFENGDLDRPIIVGSMPNPSNGSPATSENRAQNVIRTWGKNELTLDDTKGAENVYLFATKDHTVEVSNDETISVGHDRSKTVGANQSETIGADKSIEVGGSHTETIGASMTQNVGASKTENIASAKSLAIGSSYEVSVGAAMSESVRGVKTEEVGGYKGESIGGNKTENVGGAKSVSIGKSLSVSIGDSESITVAKDVDQKIGGDHHQQVGKEWAVNAKAIQLVAQDEIVLKTGKAEIIMKKSGDIVIKGSKIQVKGSGDVVIKGSAIKEN